jgi:hypothetical protein
MPLPLPAIGEQAVETYEDTMALGPCLGTLPRQMLNLIQTGQSQETLHAAASPALFICWTIQQTTHCCKRLWSQCVCNINKSSAHSAAARLHFETSCQEPGVGAANAYMLTREGSAHTARSANDAAPRTGAAAPSSERTIATSE